METIETFVSATVHVAKNNARFIRIRFQAGEAAWLTAFNPEGVASIEWVRRVSRTTGKTRTQSRYPVRVSFTRGPVVGSDVVVACKLSPRDFTPVEMTAASEADLGALGGASVASVAVAAAPAADADADEPIV